MASAMSGVLQHLRKAVTPRDDAELTDGKLMERFVNHQDRAALEVVVHPHGRMVWGVCCRVLGAGPDAEDAFQASFLVLVRRANAAPREAVANWLYGVARQTALKARAMLGKRKHRERQVANMPDPSAPPHVAWDSLEVILEEELSQLSERHRTVIILSDLEGKTRKEIAQQLGTKEGTIASRLARAHAELAKRLARRGVTAPVAAIAAALGQQTASAALPAGTVASTIAAATLLATGQAAVGTLTPQVAALMEGVLKAMLVTKFCTFWEVATLVRHSAGRPR
jgi:RNA polymerase sigma factor (sigma-70 family)